jgi:hypothetical protein
MGYSGWRFSCDRGTLERCAGALEIKGKDEADAARAAYIFGAAAALRCIIADGDGIDPAEFTGQVMSRAGVGSGV